MRISKGHLILLASSLIALSVPSAGRSATINAASASFSDVSSAVAQAAAGDTVRVPAGIATWSSTLTVNKPISLQGAGIGITTITSGGPEVMLMSLTSTSAVTRVTGFTINGGEVARGIDIELGGSVTEWGLYRVDNCRILHCTSYEGIQISSLAAGVVDHCRFEDNYLHFEVQASGSYSGGWWMDHSWQLPQSAGGIHCQVFENCEFVTTAGGYLPYASTMQNGQGCRIVFRYNTWTNFSSASMQPIFDLHGNQGAPTANNTLSSGANVRANRNTEIYMNTFVASGAGGVKLHYRGAC